MKDLTNNLNRSAFILLVEDDPYMLEGMEDLFQTPNLLESVGIGYDIDVIPANNGREALNLHAPIEPIEADDQKYCPAH